MADQMPSPKGREAEILDSIRRTFVEKGFDGASMQDLARAAGMSVGNFYRYFPSKAAMVEAIVTRDLEDITGQFATISQAPEPLPLLRAALHERICMETEGCPDSALWAEIDAAALRKPEIGAVAGKMETTIRHYLTMTFSLATGLPADEAEARFSAHAAMTIMLVKACAMQARTGGVDQRDLTALVQRMLDLILNEVTDAKTKG